MRQQFAMALMAVVFIGASASAHEHQPPHKGTLVELGEEFAHLELVLDKATGTLNGYALDGEAENAVRIKQVEIEITLTGVKDLPSITLKAQSSALTGEAAGDTSEFRAVSEKLKGVANFDGVVKAITIKGKDFKDVKFNFPKGNE